VCSLYIVYNSLNIGLCVSLFMLFICVLFLVSINSERRKTKLHFKTVNSAYTCDINSATGC
jgi:hypothetical protein